MTCVTTANAIYSHSNHLPHDFRKLDWCNEPSILLPVDCNLQCWKLYWTMGTRFHGRQARTLQQHDCCACDLFSNFFDVLVARILAYTHDICRGLRDQSPRDCLRSHIWIRIGLKHLIDTRVRWSTL